MYLSCVLASVCVCKKVRHCENTDSFNLKVKGEGQTLRSLCEQEREDEKLFHIQSRI